MLVATAADASSDTNSSCTSAATSTRVAAVQSCPALKYPAPAMAAAAAGRSASANTRTGALPPNSRWVRLRSRAADPATSIPARTEPVIDTICGMGCSTNARPVSRSPHTTLSTPGGRCSAASSAIRTVVTGVVSDGLSTTVLPAANAGANFHTAIIIG